MQGDSGDPVDDDGYQLGRTFASSTRLNLQHYLWKDAVGFNVHPEIPIRDEENLRIADVGTGTGIWLIDLSRQLTKATLDGFDISNDQFPPKQCLSNNVSLRNLDILSPIPEELVGRYDVVHVRLFLCVVRDNDPSVIISNLARLLKPGGYVQWSEHNIGSVKLSATEPELKQSAMAHLLELMRTGLESSWVSQLAESLKRFGFTNTHTITYPTRPDLRAFFTHVQFLTGEEISYKLRGSKQVQARGVAYRKLLLEASDELKTGVSLDFSPEVTLGRKEHTT